MIEQELIDICENADDSLDLSNKKINDDDCLTIICYFRGSKLNLNSNEIGDRGAKYLSCFMGSKLLLSMNNIGNIGARYLSVWSGSQLDLSSNHIESAGASHLDKWKGDILNLSYNDIGSSSKYFKITKLSKL